MKLCNSLILTCPRITRLYTLTLHITLRLFLQKAGKAFLCSLRKIEICWLVQQHLNLGKLYFREMLTMKFLNNRLFKMEEINKKTSQIILSLIQFYLNLKSLIATQIMDKTWCPHSMRWKFKRRNLRHWKFRQVIVLNNNINLTLL